MTKILFAGSGLASVPRFKGAMEESGAKVTCLDSSIQVLDAISEGEFDLLIADEFLGDMSGIELIAEVITRRPMLNCAVVSSLPPDAYHEASEGLGILMQLPNDAGRQEAGTLMNHLKKIQSFKVGS
jgi:DNA-binding NtrC family response regulator